MASFPTFGQLRSVEDRLRLLEEGWRTRVRETERAREREAEERRILLLQTKKSRSKEDEIEMSMEVDSTPSTSVTSTNGLGLAVEEQNAGSKRLSERNILTSTTHEEPITESPPNTPSLESTSNVNTPTPGGSTPIAVPRSNGYIRAQDPVLSPKPTNGIPQKARTLPPRPPPNAAHVIHLSFPSSPPATPSTLNSLIPFLHFLHSLARPRAVSTEEALGNASFAGNRARSPSHSSLSSMQARSTTPTSLSHARNSSASNLASMVPPQQQQQQPAQTHHSRSRSHTMGSSRSPVAKPSLPPTHLPLSRPLKILLHAGDGYTETSVLALSYLMLTDNRTLPEAYLELQVRPPPSHRKTYSPPPPSKVQRGRSFFVYGADVGVLRRVEARLKSEREKEREKAAAAAVAAAQANPQNGSTRPVLSLIQGPSTKDLAAGNVGGSSNGGSSRWKWGTLPSSWRSGTLATASASFLGGFASSSNGNPNPNTPAEPDSNTNGHSNEPHIPASSSVPSLPTLPDSEVLYETPTASSSDVSIPATVNGTSQHRAVPTQRPSSLSQSYAPGQVVPHRRARASTSPFLPSFSDHDSWFNDSKFDGSFPSRVLPFLYLGNLYVFSFSQPHLLLIFILSLVHMRVMLTCFMHSGLPMSCRLVNVLWSHLSMTPTTNITTKTLHNTALRKPLLERLVRCVALLLDVEGMDPCGWKNVKDG